MLNGYIQRIWAKYGINKIVMLKTGIVLVRFGSATGKDEAIQSGIYHFENKPFILKDWHPDMEFTRDELHTVPIWIKLPGLDFKYWSPKGLSKIGSLIGKTIMVDKNTEMKIGLNFARLLVEVEMDGQLPDTIFFRNERGFVVVQKVLYDWKPTLCKFCCKYGHSAANCRKKKTPQLATHEPVVQAGEKRGSGILNKQNDKHQNKQSIASMTSVVQSKDQQKQTVASPEPTSNQSNLERILGHSS